MAKRLLLCLAVCLALGCSRTKATLEEKPAAPATLLKQELFTLPPTQSGGLETQIFLQSDAWRELGIKITKVLSEIQSKSIERWGSFPALNLSVILMHEAYFETFAGIPPWIRAAYHKGRMLIPLPPDGVVNWNRMLRSLRHEHSHAVVEKICGPGCPAWLDEGIAMQAEGSLDPEFEHRFADWVLNHRPYPLSKLTDGFAALTKGAGTIAYVESWYAVRHLEETYGIKAVREFMESIRTTGDVSQSFQKTFGLSYAGFDFRLRVHMKRWAREVRKKG